VTVEFPKKRNGVRGNPSNSAPSFCSNACFPGLVKKKTGLSKGGPARAAVGGCHGDPNGWLQQAQQGREVEQQRNGF